MSKQNGHQYIKSQLTLYWALLFGLLAISAILYYLNSSSELEDGDPIISRYYWLAVLFAGSTGFLGYFVFNKKIMKIPKSDELNQKLIQYRSYLIGRYAMWEGTGLVCVVFYFLSNDLRFLLLTGFMILLFLFFKPSYERLEEDLQLSSEEKNKMEDPNEVVFEQPGPLG